MKENTQVEYKNRKKQMEGLKLELKLVFGEKRLNKKQ